MDNARIFQHPELDGNSFYRAGGKTGVLLFHGLTATTTEVRPLADFLYARGYTVMAPLLPGHGTTPQDLNRCKWQDWTHTAEDAYKTMKRGCRRVFVGGESMGGLLALFLASQHPEIAGVLLYAPALQVKGLSRSRYLAPILKFTKKGPGDRSMPWKGYWVNPLYAANQLYLLQQEILKRLPAVLQPTLIVQGRKDQTIDPAGANLLYDRLGSADKQLHWFEESGHCALLDHEADVIFELTEVFIRNAQAEVA